MLQKVPPTLNRLGLLLFESQTAVARSVIPLLLALALTACVSGSISNNPEDISESIAALGIRIDGKGGFSKSYRQTYEAVWRSAQISLKYPIAVNNVENGTLETEWIKADDGFQPPQTTISTTGVRYKIIVNMTRGLLSGKPVTKVNVRKNVEQRTNFFAEEKPLVSDTLEEKILLYRIEREIVVDEAIKRSAAAVAH